ncbi:MAG: GIY-YIG nuclease family protein [Acidobacteriaceae bacterium]
MRERHYYVYIMASRSAVLYTGITNSIRRRNREHKEHKQAGFTARYRCARLVYYEIYGSVLAAIAREKQIKPWRRQKKIALIEQANPNWLDLSDQWGKPIVLYNGVTADPAPQPMPKRSQHQPPDK